jgi:hypothetical protein
MLIQLQNLHHDVGETVEDYPYIRHISQRQNVYLSNNFLNEIPVVKIIVMNM